MKIVWLFLAAFAINTVPVASYAQSDQAAISEDVQKLLANMTPEQREAVLKQAAKNQRKLENMTPEQRQALENKTVNTAKTMDLDRVDARKLNAAKARSVRGAEKDMDKYKKKYEAGKIKNAIVYPKTDRY